MSANKAISDRERSKQANKEAYTHVSYICVQDGLNDRWEPSTTLLLQPYLMVTTDVKGKHTAALLQLLPFLLHFIVSQNIHLRVHITSLESKDILEKNEWFSIKSEHKSKDENWKNVVLLLDTTERHLVFAAF